MLDLQQVTLHQGTSTVLDDVSLRMSPSDFIAVVGPNGAGKSTLLRVALGLLRPTSGTVRVEGVPVHHLAAHERAARLAWLPQRLGITEPIPVLELVAAARYRFPESHAASLEAARSALERVQASAFASRTYTQLSGGEQQKVAIAALLSQEPRLVLMDEPASYLDPAQQIELYRLVGQLWRAGLGILCVTHDVNVLSHAVEPEESRRIQVVGLEAGRIRFTARYDAPELGEQLGSLFRVEVQSVQLHGRRFFASGPLSARQP
ncbi:ABC transporter ATP-binding protein [Hyalangium versicolor]|uniref:ABC transporter ATP-binding protein n=1 Tax=Hyalangium versicolor TaxID=2861190 RepID=UPI001CCAFC10|nr:ABC transporter ATP-binding protein [Hyalangium versicolor]